MKRLFLFVIFLPLLHTVTGIAQTTNNKNIIYRNLALSSHVTVSSVGETGLNGENAVDGDTATRWGSAYNDNEWIMLDLKKIFPVDKVILKWEVAFASAYTLQTSEDGKKWHDIFSERNSDGRTDIINLPAVPLRYLKLICHTRNTGFGSSLWEIEVYSYRFPVAYHETFDEFSPAAWSTGNNYTVMRDTGALKMIRKPSASGIMQGSCALTLPEPLPTADFPFLSFKSKSQQKLRLIVQLEYTDGKKATFSGLLNPDARWHIHSFSLDPSWQQPAMKLSLQIISAATGKDTAVAFIDDIAIGYQDDMQLTNKEVLQYLTRNGRAFLRSSATEGNPGKFNNIAAGEFNKAIAEADSVLDMNDLAQVEVDQAKEQLIRAYAGIESSVVMPDLPMKTCNPNTTLETRYLYNNMKRMEGSHIFFGQMDPFMPHGDSKGKPFRSDIEDLCGALPAVGSWDLKAVGSGFDFSEMQQQVIYLYRNNGIVSFCWHMMDPSGSGFYLKEIPEKTAGNELLPGGKYHDWYKGQLDKIAYFFQLLKGPGGESIPVLFRPFHEMDGDWFWWGKPNVSSESFTRLWQFTFNYLVNEKKVNNLLFVFSPCDRFKKRDGEMGYLDYYPGDAVVDILAQDNYWQVRSAANSAAFVNQLKIMNDLAGEKNKISGISETGQNGLTVPEWFTSVLLKSVKSDNLTSKITYISLWNKDYVPYPGHPSVPDFMKFYHDPVTYFIGDYPDLYHSLIQLP
jgi:mannan endo-1,4-beta-mannosidase